ncbi:MAG: hypothetical protein IJD42_04645 [Clostridia bacterium]|nr:hypothetical protein [Clostridia bacterium]
MQKRNRNKIIISSLVILGALLILVGSFGGAEQKSQSYSEYTEELEGKIEDFLKKVDGISDAEVIITLEEYSVGEEYTGSFLGDEDSTSASLPKVRGVAIACTNGDDYKVQMTVTEIVSKYLGISTNRIKIVSKK